MSADSSEELHLFFDYWRDESDESCAESTENCRLLTDVFYALSGKHLQATTFVEIVRHGREDWRVSIEPTGEIVPADVQIEFSTNLQTYDFDKETSALIIKGWSDRMGGAYTVTIFPTSQSVASGITVPQ